LELVARAGQLEADVNNTFPAYANGVTAAHEATSFGGGVNWYLNRAVKWVFDYEQTQFKGGNRATVDDRDDEKVFTTRLQFAY
jgi:phosphate-selective porin OprO/OprP